MEKLTPEMLVDQGICPTCYDKGNNNSLYGNNDDKMLFENDLFECFLVGNPRAEGHTAISSKKHYKDMMAIPDELCIEVFVFAKKCMNILKRFIKLKVYIYVLCVMDR